MKAIARDLRGGILNRFIGGRNGTSNSSSTTSSEWLKNCDEVSPGYYKGHLLVEYSQGLLIVELPDGSFLKWLPPLHFGHQAQPTVFDRHRNYPSQQLH